MAAITSSPHCESIPFDNTTNGFTANRCQPAIEEARDSARSLPRSILQFTVNGTILATTWVARNELMANPRCPLAIKARLKEIAWNNNNTNLGPFVIEIYKNGQVSPANLIYTYTPTATQRTNGFGTFDVPGSIDFAKGDSLFVRHVRSSGTSLSDLIMDLCFQPLP
jgi:hypothetical protein